MTTYRQLTRKGLIRLIEEKMIEIVRQNYTSQPYNGEIDGEIERGGSIFNYGRGSILISDEPDQTMLFYDERFGERFYNLQEYYSLTLEAEGYFFPMREIVNSSFNRIIREIGRSDRCTLGQPVELFDGYLYPYMRLGEVIGYFISSLRMTGTSEIPYLYLILERGRLRYFNKNCFLGFMRGNIEGGALRDGLRELQEFISDGNGNPRNIPIYGNGNGVVETSLFRAFRNQRIRRRDDIIRDDADRVEALLINGGNTTGPLSLTVGCEIEAEFRHNFSKTWLSRLLVEEGVEGVRVVTDGSLSDRGREFISGVHDNMDVIMSMHKTIKEVDEKHYLGLKYRSPCAIHIHTKGFKGVPKLFLLYTALFDFFDTMVNNMGNSLVNSPLTLPEYDRLESVLIDELGVNDVDEIDETVTDRIWKRTCVLCSDMFQRGARRNTLRYSGMDSDNSTIEFRPFPMRKSNKVIELYIKIVERSIEWASEISFEEAYDIVKDIVESSYEDKLLKGAELLGLGAEDIFVLFNRYNAEDLEDINNLSLIECFGEQFSNNTTNNSEPLIYETYEEAPPATEWTNSTVSRAFDNLRVRCGNWDAYRDG